MLLSGPIEICRPALSTGNVRATALAYRESPFLGITPLSAKSDGRRLKVRLAQ
jgi:hypothetical protein